MADGSASTERWYTAAELAGLPELPGTERGIHTAAEREQWVKRPRQRGKGWEYGYSSLPTVAQAALILRERPTLAANGMQRAVDQVVDRQDSNRLAAALERMDNASEHLKAIAAERLRAVVTIVDLVEAGTSMMQARQLVSQQLQAEGIKGASVGNIARWQADVEDAPRTHWFALLVPEYCGRQAEAPCDPRAWDWYKSYYLTRQQPTHASAYRRLQEMARSSSWSIPSGKTLARRLEREVDINVRVYLREGKEAAARRLPVQRRDRSVFGAGEAVNGDGLKFDRLWVTFEDGEIINTATCWIWQDLRTGRILAWRLGKTESTDLFRLSTYDLTAICAPSDVWIDNTRVAANKMMTAGAENRHRFKSDPADGMGLLQMLGMTPHFTNPDKETGNPGSKPIERAFGIGGLHTEVVGHPDLQDRGYSRATAVTEAELRAVIGVEVARHNAQKGRRTDACRGVLSFDDAWEAGIAERAPRVLSESQRRMLLMCRERVRADSRTGTVWIRAGRSQYERNSYWSEDLARHAGRQMVAHYDPENLSAGIHLYALDGRYLFEAKHMPTVAYNDVATGREDAKIRQRLIKLNKRKATEAARLDALERQKIYAAATGAPEPAPAKRSRKVVHGHFRRAVDPARDAARPRVVENQEGPTPLDHFMIAMRKRANDQ